MGVKTSSTLIRTGINSFWLSNIASKRSLHNIFFLLHFLRSLSSFNLMLYTDYSKNLFFKKTNTKRSRLTPLKNHCNFKFY